MKPLLSLIVACMLYMPCISANRVVDNPLIGATNTLTLDIPKVELRDTATVLHVDIHTTPNGGISIDANTYLQADGRKYKLRSCDGIRPGVALWTPDSGEASFVLVFAPLPPGTASFDFIESDCDDCYKLYDIDLTGRTEYPCYPADLPEALRKAPEDGPLPGPILAVGQTVLDIHLLGFREGLIREISICVSSPLVGEKSYSAAVDPKSGVATFRFEQYGSGTVVFPVFGNGFLPRAEFWIAPGETTDVYLDMRWSGREIVNSRDNAPKTLPYAILYSTGVYGNLNLMNSIWDDGQIAMDMYYGSSVDYQMNADEYAQMVVSEYKTLADSIARSPMPEMMRELSLLTLRQDAIGAVSNSAFLMEFNYRRANGLADYRTKVDYEFPGLGTEHYAAVGGLFDINDPKILMGSSLSDYWEIVWDRNWNMFAGPDKFVAELGIGVRMAENAAQNQLSAEDTDMLRGLKEPFYAEACEAIQAGVRRALSDAQDSISEIPQVEDDKLFDAIISPYKGKVVVVDFWNTWCGPCLITIKAAEPMKKDELKSDDLVWIYIADETSPLVAYKTIIAGITGKHYRLDAAQKKCLREKFDITSIPTYVLVGKDGNYTVRKDFLNHDVMRNTLKGMLE